jgi:[acyl-carrier-protein] S-malonyltransferase
MDLSKIGSISPAPSVGELEIQILTYIFSLCVSEALPSKPEKPHCSAGYSMGIYAALCHTRSISFETGLQLIKTAYDYCREAIGDSRWGMATIIGLSRTDLEKIINDRVPDVEITNQNAGVSFVVSGTDTGIVKIMDAARHEGALHVRNLAVTIPYHASILQNASKNFGMALNDLPISAPVRPLVSLIDGNPIQGIDDVKAELYKNLSTPINWFYTMKQMVSMGVNLFVECGPSTGLVRNANFFTGEFRFLSPHSYYFQVNQ